MKSISTNSSPCALCRYPITEPTYIGQEVKCPYCGSINTAITQVTIPTPVFVGLVAFGAGVLFGPALMATTESGQAWLERQIRERIR